MRPGALLNDWRERAITRVRGETDARRLAKRGLVLGHNVYLNRSSRFDQGFLWLISIGDDSVIGPQVLILAHDATMRRRLGYTVVAPVLIGARVFVGAGSIIMPGVTIGDDTIIGAGSVVRDDVPAGSMAVGNPVQIVGTTAEYFARHAREMEESMRWPLEGFTRAGGITSENQEAMRAALSNGSRGYVE